MPAATDEGDGAPPGSLTVVDHPLAGHLLADLRDAAILLYRLRL